MTWTLPFPAQWTDSRVKGRKILLCPDGFKLSYKGKNDKTTFYVCSRKKNGDCPLRVNLDMESNMIVKVTHEHNHDTALQESEVKRKVKAMMSKALDNPTVPPRRVFSDLTAEVLHDSSLGSGALQFLPKKNAFARNIQRHRKSSLDAPNLPTNWMDMVVPPKYVTTNDGLKFCIMDDNVPGKAVKIWGVL